jgi:DNA polymerase (family 10)
MNNQKIAKIFREIAAYYEMEDIPFKPRAYERAAESIDESNQSVLDIYKRGGIENLKKEIPGAGKNLAAHLEEIIKTGKLKLYEKLKKKIPVNLDELLSVENIGPKTIFSLYKKLKVKNINDLEKAAKSGKIAKLPNFGKQSEEKILKGIEFYKKNTDRFLLGQILPIVEKIEDRLKKIKGVDKVITAGSIRRMQETIGDIDTLVTARYPERVMEEFINMPEVVEIISKGPTKTSVKLNLGINADIRVLSPEDFGAALQYFTGDKNHNIEVRKIAIAKGYKLNEYGLFEGKKKIAGKTEEEIYKKLGMEWMPPEIRTVSGEIEAAKNKKLPELIGFNDIKGDLHLHSNYSDGMNTVMELALAGEKMGYKYLAISDHVGSLAIANAMDEKKLLKELAEIDRTNKELQRKKIDIKILKSAEVNIKKDGSIDLGDKLLAKLDIVIASVHSHFNMEENEMTERIIKAMKNPYVNIIGHLTGRIISKRPAYKIDMEKIIKASREYKVALEINSYFTRLDLCDTDIRRAVNMNAKMVINTDAHSINQLEMIKLGVAQARRGWAEKKNILNTQPLNNLLNFFKSKNK